MKRSSILSFAILYVMGPLLISLLPNEVAAQQPSPPNVPQTNAGEVGMQEEEPVGYWNLSVKTLGGIQFWTDVRYVGDWRIQRNSNTGHYRLVSPVNVRHAWGNLAHCNTALNQLVANGTAIPNRGKVVIVVHGLMRSSKSMLPMNRYLRERGGYQTVNFQYASSRDTVDAHARDLQLVIDGLGDQVTEINFVCHSLGNLVVRHLLGDLERAGKNDPRIKRMVMLGPPNNGSRMARILKNSFLFKTIAGASGAQLSIGWESLQSKLVTPNFEFGMSQGHSRPKKTSAILC